MYVPGKQNCIADALSRLLLPGISPTEFETDASIAVNQIITETCDNLFLTSHLVRNRTTLYRKLYDLFHQSGMIKQMFQLNYRHILRIETYSLSKTVFLLFGTEVIIPTSLRQFVLEKLHHTHPGINAVQSLPLESWYGGQKLMKILKNLFENVRIVQNLVRKNQLHHLTCGRHQKNLGKHPY